MIYSRALLAAAALAVSAFVSPAFAQSTLLTSDSGYTGPGLDLSAYANGQYNFTFGPADISGFTFTAAPGGGGNSGRGSVVGQGDYGLGANGSFGGDATYIGVDSNTGYDQLLGTTGYSEIGFFFNYAPDNGGDSASISTLDKSGDVLATFNLEDSAPISTPGGFNEFAFRGVSTTDTGSIYGLRFGGDYLLATGTANGTVTSAVPEPVTWAMMIGGFGLVGGMIRRAHRKSEESFTRKVRSLATA